MKDKRRNVSVEGIVTELPMPFWVSVRRLATSWEMYSQQLGAHHVLYDLQSGLRKHGEQRCLILCKSKTLNIGSSTSARKSARKGVRC